MTPTLDTSNWTSLHAPFWQLMAGDIIAGDTVTAVKGEGFPPEWVAITTECGTLDGLFEANAEVLVMAPPEPVAGYLLARQPAGFRTSLVSDCTCLYRRLAPGAGWSRLATDPQCPFKH